MAKPKQVKKLPVQPRKLAPIVVALLVATVGIFTLVQSRAASGCVSLPNEREGSTGACTRYVQTLANWKLPQLGCTGLTVDGMFNSKTSVGVRCIQTAFGIPEDGVVGQQTWRILCSNETAPNKSVVFDSTRLTAYNAAGCRTLSN